jgi:Domain of unknown function (DUF4114)/Alpha-L-fucosidase
MNPSIDITQLGDLVTTPVSLDNHLLIPANTSPLQPPVLPEIHFAAPMSETSSSPSQIVSAIGSSSGPQSDGIFFVGSTGEVEVDFLADSGFYHSEVALFSLSGMENLLPGSSEFTNMALSRALSDSTQGHIVIKDGSEGAKFNDLLEKDNFNDGVYAGAKKFNFNAGDRIAMLISTNRTIAEALKGSVNGATFFSVAAANSQQSAQFGQLRPNVFGWEDVVESKSDRDYNDLVLSVKNITGSGMDVTKFNNSSTKWQTSSQVKNLFLENGNKDLTIPIKNAPDITPIDSSKVAGVDALPISSPNNSANPIGSELLNTPAPSILESPQDEPVVNVLGSVFKGVNDFTKTKYGLSMGLIPSSDGTWNQTIANFDVPAFAADVAKTGAAYVIFSIGQTSGYYTSPNNTYLDITKTQPGQYVPTRDLIHEIALELKKINVATMVYLAAEGPTAAPFKILESFPIRSDRADYADFRNNFNLVIEEWSKRWGEDVAGWWFDGAWVDGYTNPVDGVANLNALMAAARSGNPNSIVAANPSSGRYNILSDQQDYIAGEDTVFDKYPTMPAPGKTTKQAWHTISFLGSTWAEGSANRYSNQQLIDYIKAVNKGGGVVTMDVAVTPTGHLSQAQIAQVAAVKAAVRV